MSQNVTAGRLGALPTACKTVLLLPNPKPMPESGVACLSIPSLFLALHYQHFVTACVGLRRCAASPLLTGCRPQPGVSL